MLQVNQTNTILMYHLSSCIIYIIPVFSIPKKSLNKNDKTTLKSENPIMVTSIGPSTQNTRPKTRLRLYLLRFKVEFKHVNRSTNNLANSLVNQGVGMNDPLVGGFFFFFLLFGEGVFV